MYYKNRSWLYRITWPITNYLITGFSAVVGYIYFHILNRTTVIGKPNVPYKPNTLLLSNHQSMIDSYLVGMNAFFPAAYIKPWVMPWNPAAEENFYKNRVLAWLADNWKCIPIKRGRKDVGAIYKMAGALKNGTMVIFPEGTRSRDGTIGNPRGGAGLLILETKPTVIPVCVTGMDEVLPIGKYIPRIFKRIIIYYGEPIDLCSYYGKGKNKEAAHEIMHRVMERIRAMKTEIEELRAEKKAFSLKAIFESKRFDSQKA